MEKDFKDAHFKQNEIEKEQKSILRSGNLKAVISTLEEIREGGSISLLSEVLELMATNENEEIAKLCYELICDIKDENAKFLLVEAIKNDGYRHIKSQLVAACWQNGMDYHEDVQLFAQILLNDDYITAIEAFTVIENSIGQLNDSTIIDLNATLTKGSVNADDQKSVLIRELITAIKNY